MCSVNNVSLFIREKQKVSWKYAGEWHRGNKREIKDKELKDYSTILKRERLLGIKLNLKM